MNGTSEIPGAGRQRLQLLEGSPTAAISNAVRLSDPDGYWDGVNCKLLEELRGFGDPSCVETRLGAVFVTYFDVRSSQRLLLQMGSRARPSPPNTHDFRIVRVRMLDFTERISAATAMQVHDHFEQHSQTDAVQAAAAKFGTVAHLAICGSDALIEYYDVRAAQALVAIAGTTALPWFPVNFSQQPTVASDLSVLGSCCAEGSGNAEVSALMEVVRGITEGFQCGFPQLPQQQQQPPAQQQQLPSQRAQSQQQQQPSQGMTPLARVAMAANKSSFTDCKSMASAGPIDTSESPGWSSRPGTRCTEEDLSKYDIDPERIQRNEDLRTTVMIRNLAGTTARTDLLDFLEQCNLHKRYSFFYMPFKKRGNQFAGLAFVNFAAPGDVYKLYMVVKSGSWCRGACHERRSPIGVSYARFQGHEELVQHFTHTAVLHQQDPDKRPIFQLSALSTTEE